MWRPDLFNDTPECSAGGELTEVEVENNINETAREAGLESKHVVEVLCLTTDY